ncbi:MAG: glycosyltransferase [Ktedonobacteraceae bacterium]
MEHRNTRLRSEASIAYIIKCFPRLSETFILHEVLELERQGLPLRIFSLLRPSGKINKAVEHVQATVTYVPSISPLALFSLLRAAGERYLKAPLSFLRVCMAALVRFHHPSTPKHLLYAAYIANQLEQEGITHIHAHYANTPATVAFLAHRFTGIPFSFTAHAKDIYLSRKESLIYKMSKARFVVTCTSYNQQYLASLMEQREPMNIHRIYHGLHLRVFPSQASLLSQSSGRPLILTVARLVEKKGLPYLLEACRMLKDQGYDFTCRIIGEGELRPVLEQLIYDLALSDCVELQGAETHERVIAVYQQAALFVLPCIISDNGDRDGIPNVLVESLYMGVPVVSTPISGIPELITDEANGLFVPPRNSTALADAIARLLDDPLLRRRLAVAGRQTVLAKFDIAQNARRLKGLLLGQTTPSFAAGWDSQLIVASEYPLPSSLEEGARELSIREYMP